MFMQVKETRIRVLGEEYPSTLNSIHNLAFTNKRARKRGGCCQTDNRVLLTTRKDPGSNAS